MLLRRLPASLATALLLAAPILVPGADRPPPRMDVQRIVNESYSFRKDQEPEMTEDEYALYERIVTMVSAQPEFALQLLESLTSAPRKSPAFEFVLGNVYFTTNRPDLAEQHYRAALQAYPDFVRVWSNLGALLYGQGRYGEAAECFTRTLQQGEREARIHGLLAYCLEKTGRATAAEMNYLQAVALEPENPDFLEGLLNVYYERKQYASAEVLLKQLLRLKPADAKNWLLYGSMLSAQERPIDAIAVLESGNSLGQLDPDGLTVLAELYTRQRFHAEALATYRQLQTVAPDQGAGRLLDFAQTLIAARRLTEAEQALATVAPDVPAKIAGRVALTRADLAIARDEPARAREELGRVLAADPLNGRALLTLGRLQKEAGDVAHADGSLELAARHPEFTYRASIELADLAVRTKRYARAVEFLEKAAAIEKSDALELYLARIRMLLPDRSGMPSAP